MNHASKNPETSKAFDHGVAPESVGVGLRLRAAAIELVFMLGLALIGDIATWIVLLPVILNDAQGYAIWSASALSFLITCLGAWLYVPLGMHLLIARGATPGGWMLGLRLRRIDGFPIDFDTVIKHRGAYCLGFSVFVHCVLVTIDWFYVAPTVPHTLAPFVDPLRNLGEAWKVEGLMQGNGIIISVCVLVAWAALDGVVLVLSPGRRSLSDQLSGTVVERV